MDKDLLEQANKIRSGMAIEPEEGFSIAKKLAGSQSFDAACRLAQHLLDTNNVAAKNAAELRQKLALWLSKNPDAPDDTKHDEALEILDSIKLTEGGASLEETTDPETLGIAGGICKRKWLVTGRQAVLEQSLRFYERGAEQGIEADDGYTAVNAAFVIDLLASVGSEAGKARNAEAQEIRERVRDTLLRTKSEPAWADGPPREQLRWFNETLAEAYMGLRDYDNAVAFLKNAYELGPIEPWELEATARQFAWLARIQEPETVTSGEFERSAAWGVLRTVYGRNTTAGAESLFAGKLGLALSGGGFRASLFHIGVLAALAERDLLRHVEVLSCVSGGSILGAHYYLEVRKLLQEKEDAAIERKDYVELVERLARDFLAGVQKNVRTRIGTSLLANVRMIFQPGYTPTRRLSELYERHLYARIQDDQERVLRKLLVGPKGDEKCRPKYDNWKRSNKVPILILNAATLNTGHNWQFTVSWMGEPPTFIDSEIDANYRLRRMYLEQEAPQPHRDIRIGDAVAASSCVPGLFAPLELRNLYPDGLTVRLVDGGVHDNQGIFGLLNQNCSVMMVSDASGQMNAEEDPADDPLRVLLRTTSILQARVRSAVYREIDSRRRTGLLKGLLFLHLKKDLESEDRDWIDCNNPKQFSDEQLRKQRASLTRFGVLKPVQRLIAGIRTDLDSFNETEAFALMTSGYRMTNQNIADEIQGFSSDHQPHPWRFLEVSQALSDRSEKRFPHLLGIASKGFLKVWELSKPLRALKLALLAVAGLALLGALILWHAEPLLSVRGFIAALALLGLTIVLGKLGLGPLLKLIRYRKTAHQVLVGLALSVAGWLATWTHLLIFDRIYLRKGEIQDKGD